MSALDLVFSRPAYAGGPIDLVFGSEDGAPPALPLTVTITVTLSAPVVTCSVVYDNRLPPLVSAAVSAPHQVAASADAAPITPWGRTEPMDSAPPAAWQSADPTDAAPRTPWARTAPQDNAPATRWGAARVISEAMAAVYQQCHPLDQSTAARWQTAAGQSVNVFAPHQVANSAEHVHAVRMQQAQTAVVAIYAPHQVADHAARTLRVRWQEARHLPTGLTVWVPIDGGGGITPHVPDLNLVFACPAYVQGEPVNLVFGRVCGTGPVEPGALIVIPIRSRYMTLNSLLLRRVDGDIELNSPGIDLSIDHRSWTWSWSAGLEKSALSLLAPEDGDLVEMELSVNGVPYRLHAEDVERTRKFPKTSVSSGGRGLAAELDAPVALQQYFSAASARTAQQLANEALMVNGVGIGWDIEWGLTDWLVPGGVWSHMGTHISAVSAIAAAAGGYVQPHPTARTLRVLPGYPAAPWDWAGLTPDIELPAAPVTLEGIRWQSRPAYDRVFVSAEGRSTIWDVTRGGTAGLIEAPMVVDQLATHADAARQRGIAVLGDTGRQALVTLSLPVLPETGLILPGKLVRYVDGPTTRIGLVRSCAIEWRRPRLRQRISLETHI